MPQLPKLNEPPAVIQYVKSIRKINQWKAERRKKWMEIIQSGIYSSSYCCTLASSLTRDITEILSYQRQDEGIVQFIRTLLIQLFEYNDAVKQSDSSYTASRELFILLAKYVVLEVELLRKNKHRPELEGPVKTRVSRLIMTFFGHSFFDGSQLLAVDRRNLFNKAYEVFVTFVDPFYFSEDDMVGAKILLDILKSSGFLKHLSDGSTRLDIDSRSQMDIKALRDSDYGSDEDSRESLSKIFENTPFKSIFSKHPGPVPTSEPVVSSDKARSTRVPPVHGPNIFLIVRPPADDDSSEKLAVKHVPYSSGPHVPEVTRDLCSQNAVSESAESEIDEFKYTPTNFRFILDNMDPMKQTAESRSNIAKSLYGELISVEDIKQEEDVCVVSRGSRTMQSEVKNTNLSSFGRTLGNALPGNLLGKNITPIVSNKSKDTSRKIDDRGFSTLGKKAPETAVQKEAHNKNVVIYKTINLCSDDEDEVVEKGHLIVVKTERETEENICVAPITTLGATDPPKRSEEESGSIENINGIETERLFQLKRSPVQLEQSGKMTDLLKSCLKKTHKLNADGKSPVRRSGRADGPKTSDLPPSNDAPRKDEPTEEQVGDNEKKTESTLESSEAKPRRPRHLSGMVAGILEVSSDGKCKGDGKADTSASSTLQNPGNEVPSTEVDSSCRKLEEENLTCTKTRSGSTGGNQNVTPASDNCVEIIDISRPDVSTETKKDADRLCTVAESIKDLGRRTRQNTTDAPLITLGSIKQESAKPQMDNIILIDLSSDDEDLPIAKKYSVSFGNIDGIETEQGIGTPRVLKSCLKKTQKVHKDVKSPVRRVTFADPLTSDLEPSDPPGKVSDFQRKMLLIKIGLRRRAALRKQIRLAKHFRYAISKLAEEQEGHDEKEIIETTVESSEVKPRKTRKLFDLDNDIFEAFPVEKCSGDAETDKSAGCSTFQNPGSEQNLFELSKTYSELNTIHTKETVVDEKILDISEATDPQDTSNIQNMHRVDVETTKTVPNVSKFEERPSEPLKASGEKVDRKTSLDVWGGFKVPTETSTSLVTNSQEVSVQGTNLPPIESVNDLTAIDICPNPSAEKMESTKDIPAVMELSSLIPDSNPIEKTDIMESEQIPVVTLEGAFQDGIVGGKRKEYGENLDIPDHDWALLAELEKACANSPPINESGIDPAGSLLDFKSSEKVPTENLEDSQPTVTEPSPGQPEDREAAGCSKMVPETNSAWPKVLMENFENEEEEDKMPQVDNFVKIPNESCTKIPEEQSKEASYSQKSHGDYTIQIFYEDMVPKVIVQTLYEETPYCPKEVERSGQAIEEIFEEAAEVTRADVEKIPHAIIASNEPYSVCQMTQTENSENVISLDETAVHNCVEFVEMSGPEAEKGQEECEASSESVSELTDLVEGISKVYYTDAELHEPQPSCQEIVEGSLEYSMSFGSVSESNGGDQSGAPTVEVVGTSCLEASTRNQNGGTNSCTNRESIENVAQKGNKIPSIDVNTSCQKLEEENLAYTKILSESTEEDQTVTPAVSNCVEIVQMFCPEPSRENDKESTSLGTVPESIEDIGQTVENLQETLISQLQCTELNTSCQKETEETLCVVPEIIEGDQNLTPEVCNCVEIVEIASPEESPDNDRVGCIDFADKTSQEGSISNDEPTMVIPSVPNSSPDTILTEDSIIFDIFTESEVHHEVEPQVENSVEDRNLTSFEVDRSCPEATTENGNDATSLCSVLEPMEVCDFHVDSTLTGQNSAQKKESFEDSSETQGRHQTMIPIVPPTLELCSETEIEKENDETSLGTGSESSGQHDSIDSVSSCHIPAEITGTAPQSIEHQSEVVANAVEIVEISNSADSTENEGISSNSNNAPETIIVGEIFTASTALDMLLDFEEPNSVPKTPQKISEETKAHEESETMTQREMNVIEESCSETQRELDLEETSKLRTNIGRDFSTVSMSESCEVPAENSGIVSSWKENQSKAPHVPNFFEVVSCQGTPISTEEVETDLEIVSKSEGSETRDSQVVSTEVLLTGLKSACHEIPKEDSEDNLASDTVSGSIGMNQIDLATSDKQTYKEDVTEIETVPEPTVERSMTKDSQKDIITQNVSSTEHTSASQKISEVNLEVNTSFEPFSEIEEPRVPDCVDIVNITCPPKPQLQNLDGTGQEVSQRKNAQDSQKNTLPQVHHQDVLPTEANPACQKTLEENFEVVENLGTDSELMEKEQTDVPQVSNYVEDKSCSEAKIPQEENVTGSDPSVKSSGESKGVANRDAKEDVLQIQHIDNLSIGKWLKCHKMLAENFEEGVSGSVHESIGISQSKQVPNCVNIVDISCQESTKSHEERGGGIRDVEEVTEENKVSDSLETYKDTNDTSTEPDDVCQKQGNISSNSVFETIEEHRTQVPNCDELVNQKTVKPHKKDLATVPHPTEETEGPKYPQKDISSQMHQVHFINSSCNKILTDKVTSGASFESIAGNQIEQVPNCDAIEDTPCQETSTTNATNCEAIQEASSMIPKEEHESISTELESTCEKNHGENVVGSLILGSESCKDVPGEVRTSSSFFSDVLPGVQSDEVVSVACANTTVDLGIPTCFGTDGDLEDLVFRIQIPNDSTAVSYPKNTEEQGEVRSISESLKRDNVTTEDHSVEGTQDADKAPCPKTATQEAKSCTEVPNANEMCGDLDISTGSGPHRQPEGEKYATISCSLPDYTLQDFEMVQEFFDVPTARETVYTKIEIEEGSLNNAQDVISPVQGSFEPTYLAETVRSVNTLSELETRETESTHVPDPAEDVDLGGIPSDELDMSQRVEVTMETSMGEKKDRPEWKVECATSVIVQNPQRSIVVAPEAFHNINIVSGEDVGCVEYGDDSVELRPTDGLVEIHGERIPTCPTALCDSFDLLTATDPPPVQGSQWDFGTTSQHVEEFDSKTLTELRGSTKDSVYSEGPADTKMYHDSRGTANFARTLQPEEPIEDVQNESVSEFIERFLMRRRSTNVQNTDHYHTDDGILEAPIVEIGTNEPNKTTPVDVPAELEVSVNEKWGKDEGKIGSPPFGSHSVIGNLNKGMISFQKPNSSLSKSPINSVDLGQRFKSELTPTKLDESFVQPVARTSQELREANLNMLILATVTLNQEPLEVNDGKIDEDHCMPETAGYGESRGFDTSNFPFDGSTPRSSRLRGVNDLNLNEDSQSSLETSDVSLVIDTSCSEDSLPLNERLGRPKNMFELEKKVAKAERKVGVRRSSKGRSKFKRKKSVTAKGKQKVALEVSGVKAEPTVAIKSDAFIHYKKMILAKSAQVAEESVGREDQTPIVVKSVDAASPKVTSTKGGGRKRRKTLGDIEITPRKTRRTSLMVPNDTPTTSSVVITNFDTLVAQNTPPDPKPKEERKGRRSSTQESTSVKKSAAKKDTPKLSRHKKPDEEPKRRFSERTNLLSKINEELVGSGEVPSTAKTPVAAKSEGKGTKNKKHHERPQEKTKGNTSKSANHSNLEKLEVSPSRKVEATRRCSSNVRESAVESIQQDTSGSSNNKERTVKDVSIRLETPGSSSKKERIVGNESIKQKTLCSSNKKERIGKDGSVKQETQVSSHKKERIVKDESVKHEKPGSSHKKGRTVKDCSIQQETPSSSHKKERIVKGIKQIAQESPNGKEKDRKKDESSPPNKKEVVSKSSQKDLPGSSKKKELETKVQDAVSSSSKKETTTNNAERIGSGTSSHNGDLSGGSNQDVHVSSNKKELKSKITERDVARVSNKKEKNMKNVKQDVVVTSNKKKVESKSHGQGGAVSSNKKGVIDSVKVNVSVSSDEKEVESMCKEKDVVVSSNGKEKVMEVVKPDEPGSPNKERVVSKDTKKAVPDPTHKEELVSKSTRQEKPGPSNRKKVVSNSKKEEASSSMKKEEVVSKSVAQDVVPESSSGKVENILKNVSDLPNRTEDALENVEKDVPCSLNKKEVVSKSTGLDKNVVLDPTHKKEHVSKNNKQERAGTSDREVAVSKSDKEEILSIPTHEEVVSESVVEDVPKSSSEKIENIEQNVPGLPNTTEVDLKHVEEDVSCSLNKKEVDLNGTELDTAVPSNKSEEIANIINQGESDSNKEGQTAISIDRDEDTSKEKVEKRDIPGSPHQKGEGTNDYSLPSIDQQREKESEKSAENLPARKDSVERISPNEKKVDVTKSATEEASDGEESGNGESGKTHYKKRKKFLSFSEEAQHNPECGPEIIHRVDSSLKVPVDITSAFQQDTLGVKSKPNSTNVVNLENQTDEIRTEDKKSEDMNASSCETKDNLETKIKTALEIIDRDISSTFEEEKAESSKTTPCVPSEQVLRGAKKRKWSKYKCVREESFIKVNHADETEEELDVLEEWKGHEAEREHDKQAIPNRDTGRDAEIDPDTGLFVRPKTPAQLKDYSGTEEPRKILNCCHKIWTQMTTGKRSKRNIEEFPDSTQPVCPKISTENESVDLEACLEGPDSMDSVQESVACTQQGPGYAGKIIVAEVEDYRVQEPEQETPVVLENYPKVVTGKVEEPIAFPKEIPMVLDGCSEVVTDEVEEPVDFTKKAPVVLEKYSNVVTDGVQQSAAFTQQIPEVFGSYTRVVADIVQESAAFVQPTHVVPKRCPKFKAGRVQKSFASTRKASVIPKKQPKVVPRRVQKSVAPTVVPEKLPEILLDSCSTMKADTAHVFSDLLDCKEKQIGLDSNIYVGDVSYSRSERVMIARGVYEHPVVPVIPFGTGVVIQRERPTGIGNSWETPYISFPTYYRPHAVGTMENWRKNSQERVVILGNVPVGASREPQNNPTGIHHGIIEISASEDESETSLLDVGVEYENFSDTRAEGPVPSASSPRDDRMETESPLSISLGEISTHPVETLGKPVTPPLLRNVEFETDALIQPSTSKSLDELDLMKNTLERDEEGSDVLDQDELLGIVQPSLIDTRLRMEDQQDAAQTPPRMTLEQKVQDGQFPFEEHAYGQYGSPSDNKEPEPPLAFNDRPDGKEMSGVDQVFDVFGPLWTLSSGNMEVPAENAVTETIAKEEKKSDDQFLDNDQLSPLEQNEDLYHYFNSLLHNDSLYMNNVGREEYVGTSGTSTTEGQCSTESHATITDEPKMVFDTSFPTGMPFRHNSGYFVDYQQVHTPPDDIFGNGDESSSTTNQDGSNVMGPNQHSVVPEQKVENQSNTEDQLGSSVRSTLPDGASGKERLNEDIVYDTFQRDNCAFFDGLIPNRPNNIIGDIFTNLDEPIPTQTPVGERENADSSRSTPTECLGGDLPPSFDASSAAAPAGAENVSVQKDSKTKENLVSNSNITQPETSKPENVPGTPPKSFSFCRRVQRTPPRKYASLTKREAVNNTKAQKEVGDKQKCIKKPLKEVKEPIIQAYDANSICDILNDDSAIGSSETTSGNSSSSPGTFEPPSSNPVNSESDKSGANITSTKPGASPDLSEEIPKKRRKTSLGTEQLTETCRRVEMFSPNRDAKLGTKDANPKSQTVSEGANKKDHSRKRHIDEPLDVEDAPQPKKAKTPEPCTSHNMYDKMKGKNVKVNYYESPDEEEPKKSSKKRKKKSKSKKTSLPPSPASSNDILDHESTGEMSSKSRKIDELIDEYPSNYRNPSPDSPGVEDRLRHSTQAHNNKSDWAGRSRVPTSQIRSGYPTRTKDVPLSQSSRQRDLNAEFDRLKRSGWETRNERILRNATLSERSSERSHPYQLRQDSGNVNSRRSNESQSTHSQYSNNSGSPLYSPDIRDIFETIQRKTRRSKVTTEGTPLGGDSARSESSSPGIIPKKPGSKTNDNWEFYNRLEEIIPLERKPFENIRPVQNARVQH